MSVIIMRFAAKNAKNLSQRPKAKVGIWAKGPLPCSYGSHKLLILRKLGTYRNAYCHFTSRMSFYF